MSTWDPWTLACPDCGTQQEVRVLKGIHISRLPEVRLALFEGHYQTFSCPGCKRKIQVEAETVCTDFPNHNYVAVEVHGTPDWRAAKRKHLAIFDACFTFGPEPAQDLGNTLGTIVRLTPDGRPAPGNPFADRGSPSDEIWSYGHRNPLGLQFDAAGNLWTAEMGPRGGDEVNLVLPGRNYGWPRASNGSHYDGADIPDHRPGDGFEPPAVWWTPSVSPGALLAYSGTAFPQWQGDLFVGALSGEALIRLDVTGTDAAKAEQWPMGQRIREVEQDPDGTLWLLEDAPGGRLLHLVPA